MRRHLLVATVTLAAALSLGASDVLARAAAVRVLPAPAATSTTPVTIRRLSAVTSTDGSAAVVAWDLAEPAGAEITVTCSSGSRVNARIYVSSRAGWSKRITCTGKPVAAGVADPGEPTAEIYYSRSTNKGVSLTLSLATSRGFAIPSGEEIVPTIKFQMGSSYSANSNSNNTSSASPTTGNSFDSLIPPGLLDIVKQSPYYKYLQGVNLDQYLGQ